MLAKAKITKGGKISIPSIYRKYFNFKVGAEVIFSVKDNQVTVSSLRDTLENTRKLINKYHNSNDSLVDKLILERKMDDQNE